MTKIPNTSAQAVERRVVALPDVPWSEEYEIVFHNGVDHAIQIMADALGVHVDDFSWDAATEEFEGDVRAVVGNLLNAFGLNELRAALTAAEADRDRLSGAVQEIENLCDGADEFGQNLSTDTLRAALATDSEGK